MSNTSNRTTEHAEIIQQERDRIDKICSREITPESKARDRILSVIIIVAFFLFFFIYTIIEYNNGHEYDSYNSGYAAGYQDGLIDQGRSNP